MKSILRSLAEKPLVIGLNGFQMTIQDALSLSTGTLPNAMLEKGMLTRDVGGGASTRRIGEAVVAELLA